MASSTMITREGSEFTSQFQSGIKLGPIEDPEMDSVFSSPSLYISFPCISLRTVCIVLKLFYACIVGGVYKDVKEDEEEEEWLSDSCNKIV